MRKFLFALLAAPLLFGACSDDNDDSTPTLSFAKPVLALSTGSVTLDLQVSGVDLSSLASPVTVPVAFSGTAVKGSEYSVSAEQFILGGNNQSLSITVTALDNYDEAKEIVATLGSVADFIPGKNATAKISLGVKGKIMYSFSVKSMTMGETGSVQLDLYTATGQNILRSRISSFPLRSPKVRRLSRIPILRSRGLNNWLSLRVKVQVPLPLKPARWKPEKTRSF
ncbi:MAG: hypothetical protein ACLUGV_08290 [Alistipes shahii]